MAQAADNAPLTAPSSGGLAAEDDLALTRRLQAVALLRRTMARLTKELDETVRLEREKVQRLGGLYVIGE